MRELAWSQLLSPFVFDVLDESIDADPLGDTITATLDWDQSVPPALAAALAAGLTLPAGVQIHACLTDGSNALPVSTPGGPDLVCISSPVPTSTQGANESLVAVC